MNKKSGRDRVIENIVKNIDPTGELIKSVKNDVFHIAGDTANEINSNREKFLSSLASTMKSTETGFKGDITGALYSYIVSNGSDQEANRLKSLIGNIESNLNGDDNIINNGFLSMGYLNYSSNLQKIKDLDLLVCMIPQLQEALDTMTDSVIASDSFNNLVSFKCDNDVMEIVRKLDSKYDFFENLRKSIFDGLKYGYSYTAVIPFKDAFKQFKMTNAEYKRAYMDSKLGNNNNVNRISFDSNKFTKKLTTIKESYFTDIKEDTFDENELTNDVKLFLENVQFGDSAISLLESSEDYEQLQEVVKSKKELDKKKDKFRLAREKNKVQKTEDVKKSNNSQNVNKVVDGLLSSKNGKINLQEDDISGCIIKHLDIKKLIPIKIDNTILGYYYIEDTGIIDNVQLNINDPITALNSASRMSNNNLDAERANSEFFKELSDILINSMVKDKNFLKKNNKFKEQIYSIVRYGNIINKTLKITYLSPEQVVEFGNGESMIERSLFYGKLYLALLLTNIMIKITRGYDKRIYLTKSAVAPEAASSALRAIKEIKKDSNSVTMLSNVNGILNMAGKTRDLFIPMDNNGNKAIDYDVMSGQDISIKDELLEFVEDRMLSGTGVPTPLILATTETDFSRTLQMLNTKYLRRTLTNQRIYNNPTCELFNYVNAADMGMRVEDEEYDIIIIEFLPPSALGISAMNEQVGNTKDLVDTIVRSYTDSGLYPDEVTGEFTRDLMKEICTLLPFDKIDKIFENTIQQTAIKKQTLIKSEEESNM